MDAAFEIEISKLSRAEKVELLNRLVQDLNCDSEGVVKTKDVCGGSARIANTRIAVWTLESARLQGVTEADLLRDYPSITARDLGNAWAYVESHQDEIDLEISQNEMD